MACECSYTGQNTTAGSDGGSMDGYTDQAMGLHTFCFKCTTFWIIIAVLLFLAFAASGRR